MINKLVLIYEWFIRTILYFLPDIPLIMRFRGWLYSFTLKTCGSNFQISHNAILRSSYSISIGNNVYIANNCILLGGGTIELKDEVIVGPGCIFASRNHTQKNGSFRFGRAQAGKIVIKRGSWVAANCSILLNTVLPENSVLGAGSIINKEFHQVNSLYVGSPARLIKKGIT